jgi:hypothetical protein
MRRFVVISFIAFTLSACTSLPAFDRISGVTPKTIVDVIECEIIAAKKKNARRVARETLLRRRGKLPKNYVIRDLRQFQAVAELTLQVDEQAVLAPSFSHTDVVSKTFTRAFDWGVKLDTQVQRTYSETVAFSIAAMSDDKDSCKQLKRGLSLNGKLGIEEVVDMAFGSIDPDDQGIDHPDATAIPATAIPDTGSGRRGSGTKAAFGTAIEFTVVGAITSTGPTWTLVNLKGPGKLFSTQRNDTHKLTISFARTRDGALMQNLLINNGTLPNAITRKLQLQLQ